MSIMFTLLFVSFESDYTAEIVSLCVTASLASFKLYLFISLVMFDVELSLSMLWYTFILVDGD